MKLQHVTEYQLELSRNIQQYQDAANRISRSALLVLATGLRDAYGDGVAWMTLGASDQGSWATLDGVTSTAGDEHDPYDDPDLDDLLDVATNLPTDGAGMLEWLRLADEEKSDPRAGVWVISLDKVLAELA